mmetsp:Transcript_16692/g.39635  ORF Transcript_16692/g.39635 Transcript_16692/m.39635 type:complete len:104 (+) Transcript_16692:136-447(+)
MGATDDFRTGRLSFVYSLFCALWLYVSFLLCVPNLNQFLRETNQFDGKQEKRSSNAYSSHGAAMCAIQKWGLPYIDEWIDYHLALGLQKISTTRRVLSWVSGT